MTTATDTNTASTPLQFESKEDRENYYRWVYCVKNNITDMERFGVKPLGSFDKTAISPASSPAPAAPGSGRKPAKSIDLELSPAMMTATCLAFGAVGVVGKTVRFAWHMCALITAMTILGMIIGVLIA
jgi:hypothetical protein